ncbi:response regulator [Pseudomonas nicosulfuronedens]|uniref:histidine kinase n=1 Tax=Pseudomonas nicosulfuronedens TaxID=2571105 RepID=A0A5R9R822_9PSED|nr:hybrid sensor histidine kinase/response regulator [Pseudomonas nicosulfuronedens]MDH1007604.1 response regulator [Pseudomonas nicosulfuronedens]MDH1977649.1 response regulator [Pseudomonas nicosulfuronedens]MDH2025751.1 response regulator [Pseudomonas nicosulfuronedens]TLX79034.1 response regulator [Pseudomonas nicosulfuronedens]
MKEHDNGSIRKLASTSVRLNVVLLCAVSLALMLVGAFYWALGRVVQEERDKVHFHFTRLVGDIHEHEAFLDRVAQQSDESTQRQDLDVIPLQRRMLSRENGMEIHEGREFSFAMSFTLAQLMRPSPQEQPGTFSFGVMLANFYSSYWSTSSFPSPQVLVLDLQGATSLAVPSIGNFRGQRPLTRGNYLRVIERVRKALEARSPKRSDTQVHWTQAQPYTGGSTRELLAYVSLDLPDALWWESDLDRRVVAVSLLDLGRINDLEQVLDRPVFDELELIAPDGQVLIDFPGGEKDYQDGLNFSADGLVFKARSEFKGGWTALYRLSYASFFRYAKWQFLGGLVLIFGSLAGGWFAIRWYSRRVIKPARRAHLDIVESDAFSRAVIQTAPVALCVLRHGSHQVVMQNRLAEQWLGDAEAITRISRDWDLSGRIGEVDGELVFEVEGRALHASFAPTRYRGENVVLCAFNDISAHKQAQQMLADAKLSADAASEAKSVFLATMSHEIRTPLYGVLGTLELLGLTELTRQQRDYLATIQRSSSTLLQLISDILDVSKIEAGQMALEATEFNPLELAEDVVAGYAGVAEGKELQLYACIEANVPGLVRGDAARIRQILANLLSNALKFTDIGRVVLRLRIVADEAGEMALQWQVTDTGIGMSDIQQQRLFEPFYQAHGHEHTVSGTGLGLSICARLSHLMGGQLRVVSETGLGSSFTFTLALPVLERVQPLADGTSLLSQPVYVRAPVKELAQNLASWIDCWGGLAMVQDELPADVPTGAVLLDLLESGDEPAWSGRRVCVLADAGIQPLASAQGWEVSLYHLAGIAQTLRLAQQGGGGETRQPPRASRLGKLGLRVLVAEDNPINQALLKEQLEELGCRVTLTSNGREALQRWAPGAFDALLTDVNMPVMNGYELVGELRRHDNWLPIIGVTANALREEGERCMAVGMNAWLVKPMSLRTLHDGLLKVCGHALPGEAIHAEGQDEDRASVDDRLEVSEKMRDLFLRTMRQDMQGVSQALQDNDLATVRQHVHRLRGALAVVRAHGLSDACGAVEEALLAQPAGRELSAAVHALMGRIEAALASL